MKHKMGKPCKRGHTGLRYIRNGMCVECEKIRVMKWRMDNRLAYNQYHKNYTGYNTEHIRRLLLKPDRTIFSLTHFKKSRIKLATPSWADKEEIRMKYIECVNMTDGIGIPFLVDHIIPISNPLVCGLHVPENLQIVSVSLAKLKGNKFDQELAGVKLMEWLITNGKA